MNAQQWLFVAEYLVDLNATQAAIRAGYSERSAGQLGHALLKDPDIAAEIANMLAERVERVKIDADWLLRRLADEATADISDLYEDDGTLKPISEWPAIWRQGLVQGVEVEEKTVFGQKVAEIKKIKISDRVRRLELIGKHINVRAFSERHELTGPGGGPIQTVNAHMTPQEAAEAYMQTLEGEGGG